MRLHRLEMTAFGPFAGTETVDFDTLADAGLYLIQGPTGGGKTTILDAICFALYAAVPGTRAGSRGCLRSDHADPSMVPRVVLELTVAGRRLRLTRSPEFTRPKKRGTGELKVPARVALQELVDGRWGDKGTRIDEVAQVVQDVVGLGLEQFVKVALLPQGAFAAFLRASAEDRRVLLERLFDTGRFADIEAWLAGRRRESAAALDAAHARLREDLRRVDDVLVELPPPEAASASASLDAAWTTEPFDGAVVRDTGAEASDFWPRWDDLSPGEVGETLAPITAEVSEQAATALAEADGARGRLDVAQADLATAGRLSEHRHAGRAAQAVLAALGDQEQLWAQAREQLAEAERAGTVIGHCTALDRALTEADDADALAVRAHRQLVTACPGTPLGTGAEALTVTSARATLSRLHEGAELLAAAAAAQRRTEELVATHHAQLAFVDRHTESLTDRTERSDRQATQRQELTQRCGALQAEADQLGARQSFLARLRRAASLQHAQDNDAQSLHRLTDEVRDRARTAVDTESTVIRLRQARLAGMAAELAAQLVDGQDCPVCGSAEHPRPSVGDDPVGPEEIERAEASAAAARAGHEAVRRELVALESRRQALAEELADTLAGLDAANRAPSDPLHLDRDAPDLAGVLSAAATAAAERVAAADEASAQLPQVTDRLDALAADDDALRAECEALGQARAAAKAQVDAVAVELARTGARVAELVREHGTRCPCTAPSGCTAPSDCTAPVVSPEPDLGRLGSRHLQTRAALDDLASAFAARDGSRRVLARARRDLDEALAAVGFVDAARARAACLPPAEVSELRARLRELDRQHDTARAELDKPEVIAALAAAEPDLPALRARVAAAAEDATVAHRAQVMCESAARRLRELGAEVSVTLTALGPAADEHALVSELADCVSGTGGDNVLRMRLSSYVLAARLEEIARHANERLAVMSDGRYALQHCADKAAHGARGGLGLRVIDAWTGQARETTTLSGGEAFMASLALALGLGDAVRAEAGGLDLQTLFVDEGFGSLDEESLEQVMSVLDGLREGGRSVGIVSHVPELRQRVKAQVRVTKTAAGSHISLHVAGEDDAAA